VGSRNHPLYSGQVQRFVRCLRPTIWDTPTFAMLSQPNATHQLLLSNRNNTAADVTELHAAADHQPYDTLLSDTDATQKHEPRMTQTNSSDKPSFSRVSFTERPSSPAADMTTDVEPNSTFTAVRCSVLFGVCAQQSGTHQLLLRYPDRTPRTNFCYRSPTTRPRMLPNSTPRRTASPTILLSQIPTQNKNTNPA